jgi:hypothetical protein
MWPCNQVRKAGSQSAITVADRSRLPISVLTPASVGHTAGSHRSTTDGRLIP